MDDDATMRDNLKARLNDLDDMESLLPYIKCLLDPKDIKIPLLQKIEGDHHDNDASIRKLYFEVAPNYLIKSLPPQIIIHSIFPFLITNDYQEFSKLPVINKLFQQLVSSYHKIHSINKYRVKYYIPILNKTRKDIKTIIDIDHETEKNVVIGCPNAANEEFECKAMHDYVANVSDELSLNTEGVYTIKQTSSNGWWYAVDQDGNDGMCCLYMIMYRMNSEHIYRLLISYRLGSFKLSKGA